MGYSKEEVVELFKEYDETADRDGVRYSIAYFLKEKGLLPLLEVGKWYKLINRNDTMILCYQGEGSSSYGFSSRGVWSNSLGSAWVNSSDCETTELTDEEVETALIAEAKRRGFKEGVKMKTAWNICTVDKIESNEFTYDGYGGDVDLFLDGWSVFNNGKWATIIEDAKLDDVKTIQKEMLLCANMLVQSVEAIGEEIEKLEK